MVVQSRTSPYNRQFRVNACLLISLCQKIKREGHTFSIADYINNFMAVFFLLLFPMIELGLSIPYLYSQLT